MARFYGSVYGQAKTEATRMGSKDSGIECHVRGWDCGVCVVGVSDENDEDAFHVYGTYGSNGGGSDFYICTVRRDGGKVVLDDE